MYQDKGPGVQPANYNHIVPTEVQPNNIVNNNLIYICRVSGCVVEAWQVFDKILKKDVLSWNVMIGKSLTWASRMLVPAQQLWNMASPHHWHWNWIWWAGWNCGCQHVRHVWRPQGCTASFWQSRDTKSYYMECSDWMLCSVKRLSKPFSKWSV